MEAECRILNIFAGESGQDEGQLRKHQREMGGEGRRRKTENWPVVS